ncbi:2-hydroxychromene-2-carboxylate isomerase [Pseudomaricurvus alkylphenolicus]|uniref:2-hydroxychromene-2-carboxylate isomerase n=1 Tax=Pseudomaricurvus alkylphenolicus TaxID=1306991 RepID=UPI00141D8ACF|nr:DsbA family protein [Pseudomaricurvus alkylphenolicus]NIB38617.1 2-hydroxychromene-2-carboxylate isomerase [Pseudomaricurvus alkylphenolicus]
MSVRIDLFWSFRSPYSFMCTPQALELPKDFDVEIDVRIVMPKALRTPDFFSPDSEPRIRYILMDWKRRAKLLGLPHGWPNPDPIVQDMDTLKIAPNEEQIYIFRLMRLGVEAQRRGRGLEFIHEVGHLIWSGTPDWDKGDHLTKAAERAGLNLDDMEKTIAKDPANYDAEVEDNHKRLAALPHWGVPTFGYHQEPFFGQDRIDSLRFQLEEDGLTRAVACAV